VSTTHGAMTWRTRRSLLARIRRHLNLGNAHEARALALQLRAEMPTTPPRQPRKRRVWRQCHVMIRLALTPQDDTALQSTAALAGLSLQDVHIRAWWNAGAARWQGEFRSPEAGLGQQWHAVIGGYAHRADALRAAALAWIRAAAP